VSFREHAKTLKNCNQESNQICFPFLRDHSAAVRNYRKGPAAEVRGRNRGYYNRPDQMCCYLKQGSDGNSDLNNFINLDACIS
jgi:hypothetical protein